MHPKVSSAVAIQQTWLPILSQPANNESFQQQLSDALDQSYIQSLLDASSIKYIVVPLRDAVNDDDLYSWYGNDRQYYIDVLNQMKFLKRDNFGKGELAIYENPTARPYISIDSSVYGLNNSYEIPDQLSVLANTFTSDFYILKDGQANVENSGQLNNLFNAQKSNIKTVNNFNIKQNEQSTKKLSPIR